MGRFLNKLALLSIPIFFLLFGVNYFGDPAKLFDSEYEKQMAKILLNGNFVTNIANYDDRVFQKECINRFTRTPDVIILGSSRTMLISSTYFEGQSFFNNSVVGASIEDFIALFQLYMERNSLPKKIIIGIDPWLLNENNGQSRWKSLEYFYNNYYKKYNSKSKSYYTYKYDQLISLSYFQASIKALSKKESEYSKPILTQKKYNETNTKMTDGSLVYGETFRNASQVVINSKMKAYIQGDIYSIEHFGTISNDIWNEFIGFVLDLNDKNITIDFFLTPYAPLVFDKVSKEYPNVIRTEDLINDFAKDNKIEVFGSFNPHKLRFDETYFYDGIHCKEKGIEEILINEE